MVDQVVTAITEGGLVGCRRRSRSRGAVWQQGLEIDALPFEGLDIDRLQSLLHNLVGVGRFPLLFFPLQPQIFPDYLARHIVVARLVRDGGLRQSAAAVALQRERL